jgi:replication factor A1
MSREELIQKYIEAILEKKKDISREELVKMVEEKKKHARVSEAYREVWAVFSVANELGIRLEEVSLEKEIKISSIVSGLTNISTRGRVIAVLEPKEVESSNGKIPISRILIGDSSGWCYLYLWREKVNLLQELGIRIGDVIRVARAYSKEGRLGTVEMHLGSAGSIFKVGDSPDIPPREAFFKRLGEISYGDNVVNVKAMIAGVSEIKRFSDPVRGEGAVRRVVLAEGDLRIPLTLWHEHSSKISEEDVFSMILVAGARVRRGLSGGLELELDSLGFLEVLSKTGRAEYTTLSQAEPGGLVNLRLQVLKAFKDNVLTVGGRARKMMDLIVSDGESFAVLTSWGSITDRLKQIGVEGKRIAFLNLVVRRCGKQILLSTTSSTTIIGVEEGSKHLSIPERTYRVNELEPGLRKIHVEGVVSTSPEEQEVILTSGEKIKVCRLNLVDDTGMLEVMAWRENTGKISGLRPGMGIRVKWCNVRERGVGRLCVEVTADSEVEVVRIE